MTFDPASVASRLSPAQQRRVIALARAGKSLPWTRSDDVLKRHDLIQRYTGPFGEAFAELKGRGEAVARALRRAG